MNAPDINKTTPRTKKGILSSRARARARVSLSMSKDVVQKAKEMGLNLSKVCENSLIQAIRALEHIELETSGENRLNSRVVDRAGFEPATSDLRSRHSYR